jgi:hypothetical protein
VSRSAASRAPGTALPTGGTSLLVAGGRVETRSDRTPGTDDERVSMFAIHIAGSILLHLAARRTDFTQGCVPT